MLHASMIVVGDEILGGYVTDTNSPFLADRLREHGVPFARIHVVPDTMEDIGEAVRAEVARGGPRVVVTSGGIGSTPDDLTYEAVAAALDRPLVEDPVLRERIDGAIDWSREQGYEVDDTFVHNIARMAQIPADGRLLLREGGWAAAVAVDVDGGSDQGGVTVVILPGVPSEFRALLEHAVEPALFAARNEVPAVREVTHGFPESALNATFLVLQRRWPTVKLGSYPGRPMLVRLSGVESEVEGAAAYVEAELERLRRSPGGRRLESRWSGEDDDRENSA
ncbi:MAG: competence/damage-inducible protein A [Nitriliruptoraceae bacterium]|nr:competence/damage-inducible protein A [Nitriliruptoraceae bacterium]